MQPTERYYWGGLSMHLCAALEPLWATRRGYCVQRSILTVIVRVIAFPTRDRLFERQSTEIIGVL